MPGSESIGRKIGFIGAGNMAQALAGGFTNAKKVEAKEIWATDIAKPALEAFKKLGANTVDSAPEEAAGPEVAIIRVMPNTPVFVGEVAAAIALGKKASKKDGDLVTALFNSVGYCAAVDEKLISAVTGVSGSGPAYIFILIEALADGGVRAGLPRDIAQKLAAQTVLGAAKMVLESGKHPGQLKDMVTSPAGTTITAVQKLEEAGVRSAFINAVMAATARSDELAKL